MTPRRISNELVRDAPVLWAAERLGDAVPKLIESGLPALPVADDDERFCGIFGEREFIAAAFPRYLGELSYVAFVSRAADQALERRVSCLGERVREHMNTEHVDVGPDYADAQLAETFLHHRVLILPVVERGRILGVITRADFVRKLADYLLEP